MKGRVICSTGNWYEVETDDARIFACKVKADADYEKIGSITYETWTDQ